MKCPHEAIWGEQSASHLENATRVLVDAPAVRVNHAALLHLTGKRDDAFALLESRPQDDPGRTLSNCVGNLLTAKAILRKPVSITGRPSSPRRTICNTA
jgi:hypothetical protein